MRAQRGGGRIVVVASVASLVGTPSGVAYNATKGAVLQLVRTLAPQLAPHGITVNAICPGYVRTAMTAETQADPALLARALAAHPLGRLGEPDDVAGADSRHCEAGSEGAVRGEPRLHRAHRGHVGQADADADADAVGEVEHPERLRAARHP